MNIQESIRAVLLRELRCLQRQLEAYEHETDIWLIPAGISNSAGTLTLHLVGNLQAFVGAVLGGTGYIRDRDAEFAQRDIPRNELLQAIAETIAIVDRTFGRIPDDRLAEPYPVVFGQTQVNTADFLLHLTTHLAFHGGQVDYHRRLVTGENRSTAPIAIPELASVQASQ